MSSNVGEVTERFTSFTTHSPTRPSLYLRHSPFSNPSVASPFFRLSYFTGSSLTSPGEPPMMPIGFLSITNGTITGINKYTFDEVTYRIN